MKTSLTILLSLLLVFTPFQQPKAQVGPGMIVLGCAAIAVGFILYISLTAGADTDYMVELQSTLDGGKTWTVLQQDRITLRVRPQSIYTPLLDPRLANAPTNVMYRVRCVLWSERDNKVAMPPSKGLLAARALEQSLGISTAK